MEISPEGKFARIQVLQHTFHRLTEFYQRENQVITWAVDDAGTEINPEYLWNRYNQSVGLVRNNFMFSTDTRIDRHKIIALTERVILDTQPLMFVGRNVSANVHYRLNADYAFLFGLQFLTRWNEVYYSAPFYPDGFLAPLKTDRGKAFFQEHIKLLCVKSQSPIPIFWASQLWFLLEQWGLEYMRHQPHTPREK